MKTINIAFEDKEYKSVMKRKGDLTWKQYILKKEVKKDEHSTDKKGLPT